MDSSRAEALRDMPFHDPYAAFAMFFTFISFCFFDFFCLSFICSGYHIAWRGDIGSTALFVHILLIILSESLIYKFRLMAISLGHVGLSVDEFAVVKSGIRFCNQSIDETGIYGVCC